jgi:hypothetical protein
MANLFQQLEIEAFRAGVTPRTKESREWFRKKVNQMRGKELRRVDRKKLINSEELTLRERQVYGSMIMFFYQPKHKDTLPYYDSFPLVIPISPAEGGFLGLNLHYLPPILRAKLLGSLIEVTNNKKYDKTTKMNVTYGMLKNTSKMKYFKPCIKHYLGSHVRSRFAQVEASEWEIAAFLPTADWQKASGNKVYQASRKMI